MISTEKYLKIEIKKNGLIVKNFEWKNDFQFSCDIFDHPDGKFLWSKTYDIRHLQSSEELFDMRKKRTQLKKQITATQKIVRLDHYYTLNESAQYHSENDEPAYVHNLMQFDERQYKAWYKHGKRHRENGPAIEKTDGRNEYFLNGQPLSKEEFFRIIALKRIKKLKDHE